MAFAIATVASENVLPELRLMLRSVRLFIGNIPVVVLSDDEVKKALSYESNVTCLPELQGFNLKKVGFNKTNALRAAIKRYKAALFCDADIMFVGNFDLWAIYGVMLSRHYINEKASRSYGFYNSGYMGCSDLSFLDWWDAQPKERCGSYGDQQCLDRAKKTSTFSEQHNVGWWRLHHSPETFHMSLRNGVIVYNGAPLISVHTHILHLLNYTALNTEWGIPFNRILHDCLKRSTDGRHRELVSMLGEAYL